MRAFHDWVAQAHGAVVLDCTLADLADGASLDTEIPGPTTTAGDRLVRAVPNPTGMGLLVEGDRSSFVRWDIALSGTRCTREPIHTSEVRGRVLGQDRAPLADARVHGCGIDAVTDATGTFTGTLAPVVGEWWGLDHARCVLEAKDDSGAVARRTVILDEPLPDNLRLQVEPPTEVDALPPLPEFTTLPDRGDLPAELAAVPAELIDAAITPRLPPPPSMAQEFFQEARGMSVPVYLIDDLKAQFRPGRTWVFRLYDEGVGWRTLNWSVHHVDEEGVHVVSQEFPEDGSEPGVPNDQLWSDASFRQDSSFPRQVTKVEEGTWELDGKQVPVWILRVSSMETGEPSQDRIFAKDPPGLALHATFHGDNRPKGSLDLLRIEDRPVESLPEVPPAETPEGP